jgi:hypothetical protein
MAAFNDEMQTLTVMSIETIWVLSNSPDLSRLSHVHNPYNKNKKRPDLYYDVL